MKNVLKLTQNELKFCFEQNAVHESCLYIHIKSLFGFLKNALGRGELQEKKYETLFQTLYSSLC